MDLRNIKKILNFLDAVTKDGNHNDDHILLTTNVIGVPDIEVHDVKMAIVELESLEQRVNGLEQLFTKIMSRVDKVNMMGTELGVLPAPRIKLPEPEVAAIPLAHTGSLGVIELSHNC
jgi:hypothetical protein